MRRVRLAFLAALAVCLCSTAWGQGERCGAGKDLVVQALERISPEADRNY